MAGAQRRFTDAYIKALKPKASRYTVAEGEGFGLMVWPNGAKSWVLRYVVPGDDGRRRTLTLGQYPDMSLQEARGRAALARETLRGGDDPMAQRRASRDAQVLAVQERRRAPTLAQAFGDYMALQSKRLKRPRNIEEPIRTNVLPELGEMKLHDLRRRDLVAVLDTMMARGAVCYAEQTRSKLSTFFAWCVERELLDSNPLIGMKPLAKPSRRDRALSDEEIPILWEWLGAGGLVSPSLRDALRLVLLTGQRPGEVLGLPWAELDLPAAVWRLPSERAKNGRAHSVPLSAEAVAILNARRAWVDGDHVFPGKRGFAHIVVNSADSMLARALADSGPRGLAPFRPHDLRRTCRTGLARLGFPDEVGERVLNHAPGGVLAVYNAHRYEVEMRRALDAWAGHVLALVGDTDPPGAKVIELRRSGEAGNK